MLINNLPILIFKYLTITIIIEAVIASLIGMRNNKDVLNVILVNIVTNPLVVSIPISLGFVYGASIRIISLCILEMFTLLYEGYIYYKYLNYQKINGFLVSIILNTSSFLIGEIVNRFILS